MSLTLYDYWRSSAAYRVRIGLAIKGVAYTNIPVSLHPDDMAHTHPDYAALNPQQRVPALAVAGEIVGQSLAILEWLEETYPDAPPLLPNDPQQRLQARAFAMTIACDVHPLNNPCVLTVLRQSFGASQDQMHAWYSDWIMRGFSALEARYGVARQGDFLFGPEPGLAEICLVPQIYNARRFDVALEAFPNLMAVDAACRALKAFRCAAPEAHKPDVPG